MNCKQVQRRLNAYADGELSRQVAAQVQEHLDACSRCVGELERHQELRGLLDELPRAVVPEYFARRVREKASRPHVGTTRPSVFELWRAFPVPTRVAAMLALCVGLLLGGFMGRSAAVAGAARTTAAAQEAQTDPSMQLLTAVMPSTLAEDYLALTGDLE